MCVWMQSDGEEGTKEEYRTRKRSRRARRRSFHALFGCACPGGAVEAMARHSVVTLVRCVLHLPGYILVLTQFSTFNIQRSGRMFGHHS